LTLVSRQGKKRIYYADRKKRYAEYPTDYIQYNRIGILHFIRKTGTSQDDINNGKIHQAKINYITNPQRHQ